MVAFSLILAFSLLSTPESTQADTVRETAVSAEVPLASPEPAQAKVCRTEKVTGTRLAKTRKVCMTKAEWEELDKSQASEVERRTRD